MKNPFFLIACLAFGIAIGITIVGISLPTPTLQPPTQPTLTITVGSLITKSGKRLPLLSDEQGVYVTWRDSGGVWQFYPDTINEQIER